MVKGEGSCFLGPARLHFDEGEGAATPSDNVDFSAEDSSASSEDPPTVKPQIPAGESLRLAAAPFRLLPLHLDRSRARA